MQIKKSKSRVVFVTFNTVFLVIVSFITISPFIYILASSLSDVNSIIKNEVTFVPVGFTIEGYQAIFTDKGFFKAYGNSLFYTIVGTLLSVVLTMAAAYPLSRKSYSLRSPIMLMLTITMFFGGGLVPSYILINNLGLYDTRWVMIIPGAVSAFNLVMARVFLQANIPDSLVESAKLDGASDVQVFIRIVLPLSKAILAVMALYYGIAQWNSYYQALIYLKDPDLMPLALYLRRMLILGTTNFESTLSQLEMLRDTTKLAAITQRMKYCAIIVTMLPIMCVYPFFQKHFAKGVMLGALKE